MSFRLVLAVSFLLLLPSIALAQNSNASLTGTITDSSGAAIPGATVSFTDEGTGVVQVFTSDAGGLYSFPNLVPGKYQLKVDATGFDEYIQVGVKVLVGYALRQDVHMKVGSTAQKVEVNGSASSLNFENAELRQGINPEAIQTVPLLVAGAIRSSANFISLLPGVTNGTGDVGNTQINGAQAQNGETILDGISTINPSGDRGPTGSVLDFPQSPDLISEFQVLTSSYLPQYGTTLGAIVIENVRSGSNDFHGTAYEFNRNSALNATQWGVGQKAHDIENDYGGNLGGPIKLPFVWGGPRRTYFFANFEQFKVRGAVSQPTISIPSTQERTGDFTDWTDSSGNLIPVYDPATTQVNPAYNPNQETGPGNLPYLRQQFMGCDGTQPNIICATDPRLQKSLANAWLKLAPTPTSSGALNNYLGAPGPSSALSYLETDAYTLTEKIDHYRGDKDHYSALIFYKRTSPTTFSTLPDILSDNGLAYKRTWVFHGNYDHTFSPTLLNHFGFGYHDDKYYGGGIDGPYADKLPQITGVASHQYPPVITFSDGFSQFGTGQGAASLQPWLAPAWVVNDMITRVKGRHTFFVGGEYRNLGNHFYNLSGESGTFSFARGETGLLGINSGSPIASFLLEQVDTGTAAFRATTQINGKFSTTALYANDTWKVTPKLTVTYGLRWEVDPPPVEANNHFSYFNPLTPNPGAGNLAGAIVFAGKTGPRHPENTWYKAVAPRLAFAYALTPRTVVRGGYGLYFDMANMPYADTGITQDGYNTYPFFGNSTGGLQAAFTLSQGFPQNFTPPPMLVSTIDNGQNPAIYRPVYANHLPYAGQWNLTVGRELGGNTYIDVSYVGTKGTRLLSQLHPISTLDPKLLSLGAQLYDTFQSGQTSLDGVTAPFPGFADVMQACAPSVAQALLPFPQYCGAIQGRNENKGNSTYNALQVKVEHRLSQGLWVLGSYTYAKTITDSDSAQFANGEGVFSPYQAHRNKSLALNDIPQVMAISAIYDLPVGRGKYLLSNAGYLMNEVVGGWKLSGVVQAQGGIPFFIISSSCNVPSQFREACLPALLPGANPFAQPKGSHFNVNSPLLNVNSFEPVTAFNFYAGNGPRVQNFRQFGYNNVDLGLEKRFPITERVQLSLRGDAFNVLNSHHFNGVGAYGSSNFAFNNDVASPTFGEWNGTVTNPRNMQVSGRISF